MKPLATKTKNEIVSGVGKPRACLVSHFGSQGREPDVGCISGQWLGFVNQRQAFKDFLFVSTSSLPDLPPFPGLVPFLPICASSRTRSFPGPVPSDVLSRPVPFPDLPPRACPFSSHLCIIPDAVFPGPVPSDPLLFLPFMTRPLRLSPLSRACPFSSHLCIIPDAVFSRTCPLRRFVSTCPLPGPSLLLCATLSMFADRPTRLPLVAV